VPFGAAGSLPPPPAPPPPPPGGDDRRRILVGLGAIVVLLGLIAGLFVVPVVTSDDDNDPGPAPEVAEPDDEPDPTTTTPDAPTEAELNEAVAEAKAFVEEERGLTFKSEVPVELLADEAFVDRLMEDFDAETEAEMAEAAVIYEALGIIEPGTDLFTAMKEALGGGVIGFYDPEVGNLVVRGAALTPMTRVTLVHELTHALDDQHFELDRPQYDDAGTGDHDGDGLPDEITFGFSAVVEGNASYVEDAYVETFTDEEQEQYDEEQMAMSGEIPDVPEFLLQEVSLPYLLGPDLIGALYDDGGQERVDAAFAEPPSTSEGVFHPDKFLDGETAVEVPKPEADPGTEVIWSDESFGEVATMMLLLLELDADTATEASEGWGGDRLVTWRDGDRSCVRANVVGDTPEDTEQLHGAWTEWSESAAVDATVDGLNGDDPFGVTSCTPTGGAGTSNA
jgi:hypothetical protein